MSANNLESLKSLLSSLRPGELESLRMYLGSFHRMYGSYEPKTLRLLKILIDHPRYGEARVRNIISPEASDNTFRMLITRLKHKVFEVLTLDFNVHRPDAYSLAYSSKVDGRKQLLQAEILHSRGITGEALYLADREIQLSEKYEWYELLVEACHFKQMLMLMNGKLTLAKGLAEDRNVADEKRNLIYKIKTAFYEVSACDAFKASSLNELTTLLHQIQSFEQELENAPSPIGKYWWYLLTLQYQEESRAYEQAVETSEDLLELVRRSPSVRMDRRYGTACLHVAYNRLQCGRYESAQRMAHRAAGYFEDRSFNALLSSEYRSYALLYTGDFEAAYIEVSGLMKKTSRSTAPFHHAKRKLLKASVLFCQGKYRQAHLDLQQTNRLDEDRNGWNIGVRILVIMNQIAWGGLHRPTEAFIENLYVHIRETRKEEVVPARQEAILEVLQALVKNGFNFSTTKMDCAEEIYNLSTNSGSYRWDPLGPEPIRFDTWFLDRCKSTGKVPAIRVQG